MTQGEEFVSLEKKWGQKCERARETMRGWV